MSDEWTYSGYEEPKDPDAAKLAKALLEDLLTMQDIARLRAELDVGRMTLHGDYVLFDPRDYDIEVVR